MRILIVEDEQLASDRLEKMIHELQNGVEVLAKPTSVVEAIEWFTTHDAPDLVFMDIQLEDGISFEIFESVEINAPIIFTTAYNQYAIQAFKVNSVDYLLKPIDRSELNKALEKYNKLHAAEIPSAHSISMLINQILKDYKSRFVVKTGKKYHSISIEDIDCFMIRERSTFIRTNKGKHYDIDYSLDQVQKLVDPAKFFRINRNYLINIEAIEEIFSYSSSRLAVKIHELNHLDMIVSRERVAEFKKWLG